jgi:hypothetical protein
MKRRNTLIYTGIITVIVALIGYALMREVNRESAKLAASISGTIQATPETIGAIVKTDNAYIVLLDPETMFPVAQHMLNPFLPPMTFSVGQVDAPPGRELSGSYRLLVFTDKDGNPNQPAPGELIGELTSPLPLGSKAVTYTLDRPFRNFPQELLGTPPQNDDPSKMISGTIRVAPELQSNWNANDRLIVLLFDMELGRPAAFRILDQVSFPQEFSIGSAHAMGGAPLSGSYSLRIISDKDGQPFQAAQGEIAGRSTELLPLGTQDLDFVLDTPYVR